MVAYLTWRLREWRKDKDNTDRQREMYTAARASFAGAQPALLLLAEHPLLAEDLRAQLRTDPNNEIRAAAWSAGPIADDEAEQLLADPSQKVRAAALSHTDLDADLAILLAGKLTAPVARIVVHNHENLPASLVRKALLKVAPTAPISVRASALNAMAAPPHADWALLCRDLPAEWRLTAAFREAVPDDLTLRAVEGLLEEGNAALAGAVPGGPGFPELWLRRPTVVLNALSELYPAGDPPAGHRRVGLDQLSAELERRAGDPRVRVMTSAMRMWRSGPEQLVADWRHIPEESRTEELAVKALLAAGEASTEQTWVFAQEITEHLPAAARALLAQGVTSAQLPKWLVLQPEAFVTVARASGKWVEVEHDPVPGHVLDLCRRDYLVKTEEWTQQASAQSWATRLFPDGLEEWFCEELSFRDLLLFAERDEAAQTVAGRAFAAAFAQVVDPVAFAQAMEPLMGSTAPIGAVLDLAVTMASGD